MAGLEDLFRPRGVIGAGNTSEIPPVALYGVFATTLVSVLDPAFVTLPSVDTGLVQHGPAAWIPRINDAGDPVYPEAGNICLLVFDDDDQPWVAVWWPASRVS